MQADLTHAEAQRAFKAFAAGIHSECYCSPSISAERYSAPKGVLTLYVAPKGHLGNGGSFVVYADTWRDLLAAGEAEWATRSDQHSEHTIRTMALEIISITADQGECTDAALRAKFDAADVIRFGEQACAQATEMGGLGPFSIVKLSGANDAEAA